MQLTVKLFASFRENRFKQQVMDFPEGTTVAGIVRALAIPLDELGVTMVNSRPCELDHVPAADDQVAIFPNIGGG